MTMIADEPALDSTTPMSTHQSPLVNARIQSTDGSGTRGTIRFCGPIITESGESFDTKKRATSAPASVSTQPQIWYGIEWDDPTRGKHSGYHPSYPDSEIHRLFKVKVDGSGSFMKVKARKVAFARSFLSALREKYVMSLRLRDPKSAAALANIKATVGVDAVGGGMDGEDGDGDDMVIGGKTVETVGWEKIANKLGNLSALKEVALAGMRVGWVSSVRDRVVTATGQPFEELNLNAVADREDPMAVTLEQDEVPGRIQQVCPGIVDLDLSRNLFEKWGDVAWITRELKELSSLRLSYNRFLPLESVAETSPEMHSLLTEGFGTLRILALNYTQLPWSEVEKLAPFLPNLEELYMGFNELTTLGYPDVLETNGNITTKKPAEFPKLRVLSLETNQLTSWNEVSYLVSESFPNLESLFLNSNLIDNISASSTSTSFKCLRYLNLSSNKIPSWSSIHALNSITTLTDMRLKNNPILSVVSTPALEQASTTTTTTMTDSQTSYNAGRDSHMDLIARLGNALSINGSPISKKDRADAELYYLNRVARWIVMVWAAAGAPKPTSGDVGEDQVKINANVPMHLAHALKVYADVIQREHPRFYNLVQVHGMPEIEKPEETTQVLKDRLLEVCFVLCEGGSDLDTTAVKKVLKKVPLAMTMRAVRALAGRVLGVSGKGFRMVGVMDNDKGKKIAVELNDEMREVDYYGLERGDEIRIFC
ncbi:hypothetical protein HDU76_006248 [Blyttiomyces sp. JEL0837]|nr:hypothetical protein HDU76_006248 [Blyttiomyces sp. JEL0837]